MSLTELFRWFRDGRRRASYGVVLAAGDVVRTGFCSRWGAEQWARDAGAGGSYVVFEYESVNLRFRAAESERPPVRSHQT